jgi:hypothetical protein
MPPVLCGRTVLRGAAAGAAVVTTRVAACPAAPTSRPASRRTPRRSHRDTAAPLLLRQSLLRRPPAPLAAPGDRHRLNGSSHAPRRAVARADNLAALSATPALTPPPYHPSCRDGGPRREDRPRSLAEVAARLVGTVS